jgi:hypothetical protein
MTPKYELLPRNKFDDEAVEKLALLPESELLPLLPRLAEWIQDWNWPIAPDVEKLLELHVAALEPIILEVLASTDSVWKENLLSLVRPETLPVLPALLRATIERIATTPTFGEQADEIDKAARDLLERYATHLLPLDKGDDESIERLRKLNEAESLPVLPKLLGCLPDSNWPIYWPAWELLLPYAHKLLPAILNVLADPNDDDIWKTNILRMLQDAPMLELTLPLKEIVERIAYTPTSGEQAEDTDEAARKLLARFA